MAGKIEGIIVEIGGDATGLKKTLSDVNKSISRTQSNLRDVDKLLKLDPSNTELLAQKQRLLGDAIDQTEDKLKALRQASEKAKASLEAGDLGQDKYDALQREIIRTEQNLEKLKTQAKSTDSAIKRSAGGLKEMGDAASKAGDKLSTASKGAGALLGGVAALVPTTEELNRDLSFLEQNAKSAGIGVNATERAFKTFNAVSGETDSSVEAVSNLLQAGFTESNLQVAVEGVSGAMSRFPDTLKIESLADSIQETVATGKSIGQFSEYLDRAGIGAANFDAELAKCETTTERTDLVLQALAKGGANDAYKAWEKGNKGLKKYEDATIEMQMALADLGEEIAPLAADVINFAKEGVEAFNSLPKPIKAVVGGVVGLTAASSPMLKAFSSVTEIIPKFTKNASAAGAATKVAAAGSKLLNASLLTNPYVLAAGAAAALGVAIYKVVDAQNAETKAAEEAAEKRAEHVKSVKAEYENAEIYLDRLKELEGIDNKTTAQKEQMKAMVDKLNESVEGLNLTYDEETDKLNQTTDAIERKIEASKKAAVTEVYDENAQKALDDYAKTIVKLEDAEAKLEKQERRLNKITPENRAQYKSMSQQIGATKEKIEDLQTASSKYYREAVKNSNLAAMQSGQWDDLVKEAKDAGINIPKSLVRELKQGKFEIPTTIKDLNRLIQFNQAETKAKAAGIKIPDSIKNGLANGSISVQEATNRINQVINFQQAATRAGQDGTKLVNNLTSKIANGKMTAKQATKKLTNAVGSELDSEANEAKDKGSKTGSNYSSGVSSKSSSAKSAGTTLAKSARRGARSISLYNTGYNMGSGMASGLRGAIYQIQNAAVSIANAALAAARRAAKVRSPSRLWDEELGQMDAAGLAQGLLKGIPKVEAAGARLSEAAFVGANGTIPLSPFNSGALSETFVQQFDYSQMYNAMRAANKDSSFAIVLDGRELGRGLRGMGVQFR